MDETLNIIKRNHNCTSNKYVPSNENKFDQRLMNFTYNGSGGESDCHELCDKKNINKN